MSTLTLAMTSPKSLKRSYDEASLEEAPRPILHTPRSAPSDEQMHEQGTHHYPPASSLNSISPQPGCAASNAQDEVDNGATVPEIQPSNKNKLTYEEKEVKRLEKEFKAREKVEQKAKKEEERAKKEHEKELEKAKKEKDKKIREDERLEKKKIKQEQAHAKLEEKRLREETKKKQEDEKNRKNRVRKPRHIASIDSD